MTDQLHSVREGRLLRLTLNRPEKRNALDTALCRTLLDALDDAAADPAVGAILLIANGRAFCAGMDLAEIEQDGRAAEIDALHERLFTIGARLAKPLIAGVQGPVLGGGVGLVANCHIVVAGPEADFGLTEIRLGLWPFLVHRAVAGALG
jgi:enoyl-CoA hydratase/carnithine racemase